MNRSILFGYQLVIGLSDTLTGLMLIVAPAYTLQMMGLHVSSDSIPFLSFIGAFVFSVGLACLYGALLVARRGSPCKVETVWLLTGITRASVAIFIVAQVLAHTLEAGWVTIAIFDGGCVLIQVVGLRKGWLAHVTQ